MIVRLLIHNDGRWERRCSTRIIIRWIPVPLRSRWKWRPQRLITVSQCWSLIFSVPTTRVYQKWCKYNEYLVSHHQPNSFETINTKLNHNVTLIFLSLGYEARQFRKFIHSHRLIDISWRCNWWSLWIVRWCQTYSTFTNEGKIA